MSQRARVAAARAAKTSAVSSFSQSNNKSKIKKKPAPIRKITRSSASSGAVQKKTPVKTSQKSSPTKRRLQQRSSTSTRSSTRPTTAVTTVTPRKKRLSGLTAATLLQYCTNVLSPSSNEKQPKTVKRQLRSTNSSPMSRNNQNTVKRKKKKVR
jgi:hypothetical protein